MESVEARRAIQYIKMSKSIGREFANAVDQNLRWRLETFVPLQFNPKHQSIQQEHLRLGHDLLPLFVVNPDQRSMADFEGGGRYS